MCNIWTLDQERLSSECTFMYLYIFNQSLKKKGQQKIRSFPKSNQTVFKSKENATHKVNRLKSIFSLQAAFKHTFILFLIACIQYLICLGFSILTLRHVKLTDGVSFWSCHKYTTHCIFKVSPSASKRSTNYNLLVILGSFYLLMRSCLNF